MLEINNFRSTVNRVPTERKPESALMAKKLNTKQANVFV